MKYKQFVSIIAIIGTLTAHQMHAQENESGQEAEPACTIDPGFKLDAVSRYIWRGNNLGGNAPALQPDMSLSWQGLALGFWGSYTIAENMYQENDIYLSYGFLDMFEVSLWDYYIKDEALPSAPPRRIKGRNSGNYLNYDAHTTGHTVECQLAFNGTETLPLHVMFAINVFGHDAIRIEDGPNSPDFNSRTGIQYTNYLEAGYSFGIKDYELSISAGGTFTKPRKADAETGYVGEPAYIGETAGITSVGLGLSKTVEVNDRISIPVFGTFIVNPMAERVFFVVGAGFE